MRKSGKFHKNKGPLRKAMLCIVIAWLALLLFLVYQSHVLKSRKATLFLWPFPEPLRNKKIEYPYGNGSDSGFHYP